MTAIEEALKELAVEAGVSDGDLRRAYLRRLKTAKPEVDPEGFQRVRAAYQLLQDQRAIGQHPTNSAPLLLPTNAPLPPAAHLEGPAPAVAVRDPFLDHLDRHEWDASARLLIERYVRAAEGAEVPLPAPSQTFLLILHLHETGALDTAGALGCAFHRWVTVTGLELVVLGGAMAPYWAIVREMESLPPTVPHDVRSAIARAAQHQNLFEAAEVLDEYRKRSPTDARDLARFMRARTPVLGRDLAQVLDPPSFLARRPLFLVFAAMALLRLILNAM
ncbi:MAG: J domain-containing protein, partial [Polyangiaceae bacterium]